MGASDANTSYSSSYEEKEWDNMVNACIPAHQGTMDSEHQIWTDVQVSFFYNIYVHFYRKAIIYA